MRSRALATLLVLSTLVTVPLVASVSLVGSSGKDQESTEAYFKRLKLGTTLTVFVVFSADCAECRALSGFYKRIMGLPGFDGVAARLVALTRGGAAPAQLALKEAGVRPSAIGAFPDDDPAGLPTTLGGLALFDGNGRSVKIWSHLPSPREQEEIVASIKRLLTENPPG